MITRNSINSVIEVNNFLINVNKEALVKLENHFKYKEKKFDKTIKRKTGYVSGKRSRVLGTPISDITITRRIYINRFTWKTKILLDKEIGLEPYTYIQQDFGPIFMMMTNKIGSYKKLSKIFGYEVSEGAIAKMMKEGDLYFKPKQLTEQDNTLYVNVDGIFINSGKARKGGAKSALAYTDS